MTKPFARSLTILAVMLLVALVVDGCAVPTPTPAPATPSIGFTTPGPKASCPSGFGPGTVPGGSIVVESSSGPIDVYLEVTGFQAPGGPIVPLPVFGDDPTEIPTLIGGRDLHLAFRPPADDDAAPGPFSALTLGLDDGSSAITLLARLDDTGASVALPDRALTGLIDMNVTWADSCFTYGGSARLAVEIVPSAAADACPDAAGIMDQVRASQDVEVELAGARAGLGTLAWQARFLPGNGADAVPAFAGFDPDRPPAVADAGEVVPLRILDPGFALVGAALTIYERDDVVDATGHLMDVVAEPTRMTVTVGADGLVGIPFPTEPGQYVVAIEVSWERPCVVGEGLLYLSLIAG